MEQWYKISSSELLELLHDSMKLMALENGGVDNWEWYGVSLCDFLEDTDAEGFYDLAREELGNYEVIDY